MNLKQKIRDYFLQKSRNISYRPSDYGGYEKLKKLALVFETSEQDKTILSFAQKMEREGKEVRLLGYIPQKRKELTTEWPFDHFTRDEVNWLGKPKSEGVKHFLNDTYEVFITLNEREESPLQFITVAAKADFVVGVSTSKTARVDLQVQGTNYQEVFKEVEYYLRFINSSSHQK